jgi:hypothetical protein
MTHLPDLVEPETGIDVQVKVTPWFGMRNGYSRCLGGVGITDYTGLVY